MYLLGDNLKNDCTSTAVEHAEKLLSGNVSDANWPIVEDKNVETNLHKRIFIWTACVQCFCPTLSQRKSPPPFSCDCFVV